jgi:hypothetical protein
MLSKRTDAVYEFGPFRLEVKEHRLIREGRSIPLTGKAFETLRVLLERHGTLVSKRDLMNAVWPDTAVEENNLDRNISALRKALGERPRPGNTSKRSPVSVTGSSPGCPDRQRTKQFERRSRCPTFPPSRSFPSRT